jgi:hypothetical protein
MASYVKLTAGLDYLVELPPTMHKITGRLYWYEPFDTNAFKRVPEGTVKLFAVDSEEKIIIETPQKVWECKISWIRAKKVRHE